MQKLQNTTLEADSFFVGTLFPFVEEGKLFLLVVHTKDKYTPGKVNTKLPGGSGDRAYADSDQYLKRLEDVLAELSFDRLAVLKILNHEYDRKALFGEHPQSEQALWLLQTMVLECLEATGYYPADLDPWVVDVVERAEDHYQYFLEIKEWWDKTAEIVKVPQPDEAFKPLDQDVVHAREKLPILDFEEVLISTHCRPVEFYIEHLKSMARRKPPKE